MGVVVQQAVKAGSISISTSTGLKPQPRNTPFRSLPPRCQTNHFRYVHQAAPPELLARLTR